MSQRRFARRSSLASVVSVAALMACASPAMPSVTIGQIALTPGPICSTTVDRVQPVVSSGNTYSVPANGTITSWSTNAGPMPGQLKMKVFRPVGGDSYRVVGHDGPRDLTVNAV